MNFSTSYSFCFGEQAFSISQLRWNKRKIVNSYASTSPNFVRNFPMIVNWRTICVGHFQHMPPILFHALNWWPPKKTAAAPGRFGLGQYDILPQPQSQRRSWPSWSLASWRVYASMLNYKYTISNTLFFTVVRLKLLHCNTLHMHSIKCIRVLEGVGQHRKRCTKGDGWLLHAAIPKGPTKSTVSYFNWFGKCVFWIHECHILFSCNILEYRNLSKSVFPTEGWS